MSPAAQSTPWPDAAKTPFTTALSELVNRPAIALESEAGARTVAPPLWARWHAARDRLVMEPAARPQWFHELNADPRLRVSAGLGAEIVRRNDQNLVAAAWDQIEGVLEANAELRRAQLARESAEKVHSKHYAKLDTDSFLAVSAPLQARFRASPITFHEALRRSPIPEGALDGQMRRIRRPAGPIAKRQGLRPSEVPPRLLERLNAGEVRARPPVPTPDGMMTPGKVLDRYRPSRWIKRAAVLLAILVVLLVLIAAVLFAVGLSIFAVPVILGALAAGIGAFIFWKRVRTGERDIAVLEGTTTPGTVRGIAPTSDFVPGSSRTASNHIPVPPADVAARTAAAAAAVGRFRDAFVALASDLTVERIPGAVLVPVDIPAMSRDLLAKMNPRLTIPAAVTHRLRIADWVTWKFDDPLEPIMAAPEFDMPMYEPLRDYGQDWVLPGVGRIPPDTVTLVASNQRFIEAYMAGLSHEMGRELLYHEYPTDQRGTYFRQFWDVRGVVGEDGQARDPQTLRDINQIHTWSANQGLGVNSGQAPPPRDNHLVFLIKGELLRRYPSTLVYAIRTTIGEDGRRALDEQKKYPVFEGRLEPDIAFFGFDLLPEEVRGDTDPAQDQGWYFMLEEQSSDPIFGLDADDGRYAGQLTSVNDLSWSHLATDADALRALGYIDLNAELPDTSLLVPSPDEPTVAWHAESGRGPAGANSSDLAYMTLQRPFRVAIHGSDMLPPEAAP